MIHLLLLALTVGPLRLDLTPGSVHKYEVTRDYKATVESDRTTFVDEVSFRVEKDRVEDRSKVTSAFKTVKTVMDGTTIPAPADAEPVVLTEERRPTGLVTTRQMFPYESVIRERQRRVTDLVFSSDPVTTGFAWSRDLPEITGDGIPPVRWDWTCTAQDEKTVTLKLTFSERECNDPITADGMMIVNKATGWPESVDVTLHNTITPGDSENIVVDLHVTWRKM